jgi:hypothetical protein
MPVAMPIANDPKRIRSDFQQALADGTVSTEEAQEIISDLAADKVTRSEGNALVQELNASRDEMDAPTEQLFDAFIASMRTIADNAIANGSHGSVGDPGLLTRDGGSLHFEGTHGDLFIDGVSGDDAIQGSIANCYVPASFAAIAYRNPELIPQIIKSRGDGTYSVRFFEKRGAGFVPVEVIIDGDLPVNSNGQLRYAKSRNAQELWVPLLEKAYAQWKGGYQVIGDGGVAGEVMMALTGRQARYYQTGDTTRLYNTLKNALSTGRSAVLPTPKDDPDGVFAAGNIKNWHAYTVVDVSEENGARYVTLRNPWGNTESGNDGTNDGIFKMRIEDVPKYFQSAQVV